MALILLVGLTVGVGLWIGVGVHDEYGGDATIQVLIGTLVIATALGLAGLKLLHRASIGDTSQE